MDDTASGENNENNDSDLTRREFLRQAAYGTAAVGGVLLLGRTNAWAQGTSAEIARFGQWSEHGQTCTNPAGPFSVKGIHAALLSVGPAQGHVLFFSYNGNDYRDETRPGVFSIWNPADGGILSEDEVARNPFCSGHAFATNGNLLVVGGHHAPNIFDPNPGPGGMSAVRVFTPHGITSRWLDWGVNLYCGVAEGDPPAVPPVVPAQAKRRWYPTCVALPGRDVNRHDELFIISGTTSNQSAAGDPVNGTYEFWPQEGDPQVDPPPLHNELEPILSHDTVKFQNGECQGRTGHATYPFVFVLPTGNMLIHCNNVTQFFTLNGGTTVETQGDVFPAGDPDPAVNDARGIRRAYPNSSTAVLLPLQYSDGYKAHVMLIGGGGGKDGQALRPATPTCLRLDTSDMGNRWVTTNPMAFKRVMPDSVLLPDATVLVVGGAEEGLIAHARGPVYETECYDPGPGPGAGQWHRRASMNIPRGYHSTALLLPDGSVMSAGSADNTRDDPSSDPNAFAWQPQRDAAEFRVEVFKPPYLYNRASPNEGPPRPVIIDVNGDRGENPNSWIWIEYGHDHPFTVKFSDPLNRLQGEAITAVALIRSSSVTHGFNADQRYVGLRFEEIAPADDGRMLSVTPPPNAHVAPPGFYMLFIVAGTRTDYDSEEIDANGFKCPSVAKFVRLSQLPNF